MPYLGPLLSGVECEPPAPEALRGWGSCLLQRAPLAPQSRGGLGPTWVDGQGFSELRALCPVSLGGGTILLARSLTEYWPAVGRGQACVAHK